MKSQTCSGLPLPKPLIAVTTPNLCFGKFLAALVGHISQCAKLFSIFRRALSEAPIFSHQFFGGLEEPSLRSQFVFVLFGGTSPDALIHARIRYDSFAICASFLASTMTIWRRYFLMMPSCAQALRVRTVVSTVVPAIAAKS